MKKCLLLPSECTLQDDTNYVEERQGFDPAVDKLLIEAVKVHSSPEWEKCVLLKLDEMDIREQLIFDKHSGSFVGFTYLSDIVDHLSQFEQEMSSEDGALKPPKLAKMMMVFMAQGFFSSLQFLYVQFPCADITGDMLYDPFWEAVRRIEACDLKVCTCRIQ